MTNDYNPDYATHPGEHLEEYLEHDGYPITHHTDELWEFMSALIAQKPGVRIDSRRARQLAEWTKYSADLWLNLQAQYDTHPNSHYRCTVHDHWEGGKHQCPRGKYCPKCGGKVEKVN